MNNLKEDRIRMLDEIIKKIKEVSILYKEASPGWVLLQAAYGHINSIHHLESETKFSEKTLGVKRAYEV